ncbi:MAG: histidine phosphatase family protein [Actinobacteria bacterium]|nr:histidine phosphatase family protein [Actinomycetota bacterium]
MKASLHSLYVLRHAKAEPASPGVADHDRHLTPWGQRDASWMARSFSSPNAKAPEMVLCSSALRATETMEALSLPASSAICIEDRLYRADACALLQRLGEIDPGIGSVLVVGHNPALHDLVAIVAGPKLAEAIAGGLPTCSLATLELGETRWDRLGPGTAGSLTLARPPKDGPTLSR